MQARAIDWDQIHAEFIRARGIQTAELTPNTWPQPTRCQKNIKPLATQEPSIHGTLTRNLAGLRVDGAGLTRGRYDSPNRHKQARSGPTISGWISIHGVTPEIAAVFTLGPRCHLGRHAAEGLGAFSVDLLE